jgi:uncharacterized membrane protein
LIGLSGLFIFMDSGLGICQFNGKHSSDGGESLFMQEEAPYPCSKSVAWSVSGFLILWTALSLAAALPGREWLRPLFAAGCHQIPERCYSIGGHPAGLCVRCVWIYLGMALGHPLFTIVRMKEGRALRMVILAALLIVADVALETAGVYNNWKVLRSLTGAFFGTTCSWFTLRGLSELTRPKPTLITHEST